MVLLQINPKSLFTLRSSITSHTMRDIESKFAIPLPRTNFLKKQFQLMRSYAYLSNCGKHKLSTVMNSFRNGCRHCFQSLIIVLLTQHS